MPDAKVVISAIDDTKGAFASIKSSLNGLDTDVTKLTAGLGALAAAAGLVAVGAMVADTVKAAASLADLSTVTGASVESLSKFAGVAKLSGTDIDAIANSMNKLAKNMAGASEDGKGAAAALRAIGVDFNTFSRMSPDEKMLALAQSLDQFKDGSDKSAVAMALLGKEGARLLPFFKDLAVAGDIQARITTTQAEQSKQLEENLKRLSASGDGWKKELAAGMTPALNTFVQALTDVVSGTGGLREGIRKLAQDGTIAEWTRGAIVAMTYLMDTVQVLVRVFTVAGKVIYEALSTPLTLLWGSLKAMAKAASGDLKGAAAEMTNAFSDVGAGWAEAWKEMEDAVSAPTFGSKLRDRMDALEKTGAAAATAKKGLKFDANDQAAADKQTDAYNKLIVSLGAMAEANEEVAKKGRELTDDEKQDIAIKKLVADGIIRESDAISENTKRVIERLKQSGLLKQSALDEAKARVEAAKQYDALVDSLDAGTQKLKDELQTELEHNTAMLQGKEAAAELAAAKLDDKAASLERRAVVMDDIDLTGRLSKEMRDQAQAARDLAAAKRQGGAISDQIKEFKASFETVDRVGKQVWDSLWEGGLNVFKNLGKLIKTELRDALYSLVAKPWIVNIVTSLTGTNGAIAQAAMGNASGGVGLGNALGLNNLFGQGGSWSLSNVGTTGAGVGGFLGFGGATTGGAAVPMPEYAGAAAGGSLGALGAAMPYVGLALLAGQALGLFGSSHGPKTESGYGDGMSTGSDATGAQTIAQAIQQSYGSLAQVLGVANTQLANLGVFYSKDPNGTAQTQLQIAGGSYSRAALDGGTENVGRSDADFQQAVSLASAQLVVKNLQDAVGGKIGDFLKSVDITSASLDTLQSALQITQDVGTFAKLIDSFGGVFDGLKSLSVQDTENMITGLGGLQSATAELQAFYNDFTPEADKQDAIWRSLVKTFTEAGVVLPSTRDAFRGAVLAAQAAGDAHALQTLLGAEAAFNSLYPAIDSTAAAASSATQALNDWQTSYFKSWASSGDAATKSAQATSAAWGEVFSGMRDSFGALMGSISDQVARIRGDLVSNPVGVSLASAQANFDSLIAQVKTGGSGSMAAAQQLGDASNLLLNVAQSSGLEALPLSLLKAKTAQALANVQPAIGRQNAADLKSVAQAYWSSTSGYSGAAPRAAAAASGSSDASVVHIREMSSRLSDLHAVVSRQQEMLGDLLNGRQRAPLSVTVV